MDFSDTALLRIGIAVAFIILVAVILFSSRKKPEQGIRTSLHDDGAFKRTERNADTTRKLGNPTGQLTPHPGWATQRAPPRLPRPHEHSRLRRNTLRRWPGHSEWSTCENQRQPCASGCW